MWFRNSSDFKRLLQLHFDELSVNESEAYGFHLLFNPRELNNQLEQWWSDVFWENLVQFFFQPNPMTLLSFVSY